MNINFRNFFRHYALLASLSLLVSTSRAQKPDVGFFTLINAVESHSNTIISVDGKPLRPDGLKPGKVTGGLGFPAGAHRVEAKSVNCQPATSPLQIVSSKSGIVIIYKIRSKSADGRPVDALQIFERSARVPAATGKSFSIVYAGQGSVSVVVNGQTQLLKTLQEVSLGNAGSASVVQNGLPIGDFTPREFGAYLVVLYQGKGQQLNSAIVDDIAYKVAGQPR